MSERQTTEELRVEIIAVKQLRKEEDSVIQSVKSLPPSRERALCITKLQEAMLGRRTAVKGERG